MSHADSVKARVRAGGLLAPGRPVLVLLSGGRDSTCLLDLAVRIAGAGAVAALHVDHGLRPEAAADAAHCAALCARLGVPLAVEHPAAAPGNVQAWAREARYAAAERRAAPVGADVAAGHTASDQAEGVLYRLAAAPGRRALLGMRERRGRLVRPLLAVTREETAAYCRERDLPWVEDASNASRAYARNRARADLLPAFRGLHPAAEANLARTLTLLRDEAAVLDAAAAAALAAAGDPPALAGLVALPPALGRLAVQRLADRAAPGGAAPALGRHADAVLALAGRGGTVWLDLPGGLRAMAVYGRLRVEAGGAAPPPPEPVALQVPGRVRFGAGLLTSERGPGLPVTDGTLAAAALRAPLEVRTRRPGDRMRPLGLGGSRSVQDLLTDRKVPRLERPALPVVCSGGEIAWIPGVATGEAFRVDPRDGERVRLTWRPAA